GIPAYPFPHASCRTSVSMNVLWDARASIVEGPRAARSRRSTTCRSPRARAATFLAALRRARFPRQTMSASTTRMAGLRCVHEPKAVARAARKVGLEPGFGTAGHGLAGMCERSRPGALGARLMQAERVGV